MLERPEAQSSCSLASSCRQQLLAGIAVQSSPHAIPGSHSAPVLPLSASHLWVQALRAGTQPGCWQSLRESCRCLQVTSMPGWALLYITSSSSPSVVSAAHAGYHLQLLCPPPLPAALTPDQQCCRTHWLPKLPMCLGTAQAQSWQLPMWVAPLSLGRDCQGNIKEGNITRKLPLDSRLRHVDQQTQSLGQEALMSG